MALLSQEGGDACEQGVHGRRFKSTLPCRQFVQIGFSIAVDVADGDGEAGVSRIRGNDS